MYEAGCRLLLLLLAGCCLNHCYLNDGCLVVVVRDRLILDCMALQFMSIVVVLVELLE